jgi:hypothetical protein
MAALTADQRAQISQNGTFRGRIAQILRDKGQYWKNFTLNARADVNQAQQKRKRFSKSLLQNSGYAETIMIEVGNYWLTLYTVDPAVLDGEGMPTAAAINDTFDPTYDYFAGVIAGDENQTEIDW